VINADILNELAGLGLNGEQLSAVIRVVAKIQAGEDERKAAHRAAQAKYRNSKRKGDITSISPADHQPSPDKEGPQTPKEITLIQENPSPPKGGSVPLRSNPIAKPKSDFPPNAFDELFWPAYPRKEGKGSARKVFDRIEARGKTRWADLIEGLRRFARDPPEPRFTPHAATWLNAERWTDEPANSAPANLFSTNRSGPREDPLITAARREIDGIRGSGWG
jgi:hypothetical protein